MFVSNWFRGVDFKMTLFTIVYQQSLVLFNRYISACSNEGRGQYYHKDSDAQVGIVSDSTDRNHSKDALACTSVVII